MGAILVTGGTGFIGSHTCIELINAGKEIVIMDNFYNSNVGSLNRIKEITGKDFKFYQTDMLDIEGVCKIFKENNIEAVIHFAGYKAVGESVVKPIEYYHNNITGTLTLISAMKKYNCKNIVFSSSATVYGMNNPIPYVEDMPTSATSPYGFTKVMIEQIFKDVAFAEKDWSVVLLRFFNPIGAHKSGLIGENPNGIPNNLLPYIAQVAIGKLEKVNVYGNDYNTPDGTGVRDYIHVVDLAKGHLAALKYTVSHTGTEAINLGTGKGSSVLDVIKSFEKACGKQIPYTIVPRRQGDIDEFYANTEKAKSLLNWQAEYQLDEMTSDSWNFIKNNPNGL